MRLPERQLRPVQLRLRVLGLSMLLLGGNPLRNLFRDLIYLCAQRVSMREPG